MVGFVLLFLQTRLCGLSTHCFLLEEYSIALQGPVLHVRGTLRGIFLVLMFFRHGRACFVFV